MLKMLVDQTGFAAFEQLKELGSIYRDVSPYKEPIKGFLQKGESDIIGSKWIWKPKMLDHQFQ